MFVFTLLVLFYGLIKKDLFLLFFQAYYVFYFFIGFLFIKNEVTDLFNFQVVYATCIDLFFVLGYYLSKKTAVFRMNNFTIAREYHTEGKYFSFILLLFTSIIILFFYITIGVPVWSPNAYIFRVNLYKGLRKLVWYIYPIGFVSTILYLYYENKKVGACILFVLIMAFLSFSLFLNNLVLPFLLLFSYIFFVLDMDLTLKYLKKYWFGLLILSIAVVIILNNFSKLRGENLFERLFCTNVKNYLFIVNYFKPAELSLTYFNDFMSLISSELVSFAEKATLIATNYKNDGLVMTPTLPAEIFVNFNIFASFIAILLIGFMIGLLIKYLNRHLQGKSIFLDVFLCYFSIILAGIVTQGIGQIFKFLIPQFILLFIYLTFGKIKGNLINNIFGLKIKFLRRRERVMSEIKKIIKKILKIIVPEKILFVVRRFFWGNYCYILWLFPIKKNKIVICNYNGKGYGDNGKYIVEQIIEQNLNFDIVWLLNKELMGKSSFPPQVRTVKHRSLRALYELATAQIWIDNCRKSFYPPKRKNQFYIQTWHGGIALKKVEKDVESKLSRTYVNIAKKDSEIANLFLSNSKFCTNLYRNAFWYCGDIIECGSPRNDVLLNNNTRVKQKVRSYFNLNEEINILIYAPTFRADYGVNLYRMNFKKLIEILENSTNNEWCILVRLHPNISDKADFIEYDSKVINATDYDDMYELLATGDILITDYSSTMFEFSLMYKPVFLYAPDIEEYKKDRDFYFDIFSLPFPVAETEEQLYKLIESFDRETYTERLKNFFDELGIVEDGNAAKRVVELIVLNTC